MLDLIAEFRKDDQDTPVILMGYLNPVEAYGHARFCEDAAAAGVDGLILVDLPPEEADILEAPAQSAGWILSVWWLPQRRMSVCATCSPMRRALSIM